MVRTEVGHIKSGGEGILSVKRVSPVYNRYGVEKSLIEKQAETVLRLLTELKKTRFLCSWDGNLLQLALDSLHHGEMIVVLKMCERKELLFDGGYAEGLNNIWGIADDLFLPVQIAEKIKPLTVSVIIASSRSNEYMEVKIPGHSHEDRKNHFYGLLNGKPMDMKKFVELWSSVIESAEKWLKERSNMYVGLNFERK